MRPSRRTILVLIGCHASPATIPIRAIGSKCSTEKWTACSSWARIPPWPGPNSGMERRALGKLKWLVVREMVETETASFWYESPEVQRGELRPEQIPTEVFLMPAAGHAEKDGTFTNTQRLLQWREKAVHPPGDSRSENWFGLSPGPDAERKSQKGPAPSQRGSLALTLHYHVEGKHNEPRRRGNPAGNQRLHSRRPKVGSGIHRPEGRWLHCLRRLDLLRRLSGARAKSRQRARLERFLRPRLGLGLAVRPPRNLQSRFRAPPTAGHGANARSSSGGMRKQKWTGNDIPDFVATKAARLSSRRKIPKVMTRFRATSRSSSTPMASAGFGCPWV